MILAIDPGKNKCGLAVLDSFTKLLERKVIVRRELGGEIVSLIAKYRVETIVVGSGTYSKSIEKDLIKLDLSVNVVFIPEKYTTHEARRRYWKENTPFGILRFIPRGLLTPPVPVDDYAAQVLGERYLKS